MKLLRNSDFKFLLFVELLITLAFALTMLFLAGVRALLVSLFFSLLFIVTLVIYLEKKRRELSSLSEETDRVLHGDRSITFDSLCEGEIGVLKSEIYKMVLTLRENEEQLKAEKVFLADSLADISHQIKTPLTSINLAISMLTDPKTGERRKQELKEELYMLLLKIETLVSTLLKISKLDAGTVPLKKEKASLEALIDKACISLLVPAELKDISLEKKVEGNFEGDIMWSAEAVTNIIKNCIDYTPQGGKIEISAHENPLFSEIVIEDNGSGIDENDLPHIFERFYKGKKQSGGFGIGLSLARTIVTSQGGNITAENRTGNTGARFVIRFYKGAV